jgi:hypothetical protein
LIPSHYKINFSPDNALAESVNAPFAFFETVELEEGQIIENTPEEEDAATAEDIPEEAPEKIQEEVNEDVNEEIEEEVNEEEVNEEIEEKIEEEVGQEIPEEVVVEELPPHRRKHRRRRRRFSWSSSMIYFIILLIVANLYVYIRMAERKEAMDSMVAYEPSFSQQGSDNRITNLILKRDSTVRDSLFNLLKQNNPDLLDSEENANDTAAIAAEDTVKKVAEEPQPLEKPSPAKSRVIRAGETLTVIALEAYGSKFFWVYLYEENASIITNPNNVPAGLTLVIPPAEKYDIDKDNPESVRKAKELARKYAM